MFRFYLSFARPMLLKTLSTLMLLKTLSTHMGLVQATDRIHVLRGISQYAPKHAEHRFTAYMATHRA